MAELIRTGPSGMVDGIGFVRRDVITTVPDDLVKALLATGQWAQFDEPTEQPERVTEPAPAQPAKRKTTAKKKR